MHIISFKLKPIAPIVSLDTGRAPVETDILDAMDEMLTVLSSNMERFIPSTDNSTLKEVEEMVGYWTGVIEDLKSKDRDDPEYDFLNDLIGCSQEMESVMSSGGYSAFAHGEANSFFIYDGPTGEGDDDYIVGEMRDGWHLYCAGEKTIESKSRDGLIVLALEEMEHDGYHPDVIVLDQHDNMSFVFDYNAIEIPNGDEWQFEEMFLGRTVPEGSATAR